MTPTTEEGREFLRYLIEDGYIENVTDEEEADLAKRIADVEAAAARQQGDS